MKVINLIVLIVGAAALIGLAACGGSKAGSTSYAVPPSVDLGTSEAFTLVANDTNVVTVNLGSSCQVGSSAYQNEICVSATICNSSTSNCTTVNNLLLDTGSYGLRVFKSTAITALSLPAVTDGTNAVYNCVSYLDKSAQWGTVNNATVQLGSLTTTSAIPIEIIDKTAGTPQGDCGNSHYTLDSDAATAGFNGIIGLGVLQYDCGSSCDGNSTNRQYYTCSNSTCTGYGAPVAKQVRNPIMSMPTHYNNGIILNLPAVAGLGATSAVGQMILGIGYPTRANTVPTTAKYLQLNTSSVTFSTTFNGTAYSDAFIDSGSNGIYFPYASSLCTDGQFLCPSSWLNFNATMTGTGSGQTLPINFQIENTDALLSSNSGRNRVFYNFGGSDGETAGSHYFDWGLPIFLGRRVYVGIEGGSSITGTGGTSWSGAYWAL